MSALSELGKKAATIIDLDRRMAIDAEVRIGYRLQHSKKKAPEVPFQTAKKKMLQSRALLEKNNIAPI